MELGIVDQVVPLKELGKEALKTAQRFAQQSSSSLSGITRLLNYSLKDLGEYLELENEELFRIVNATDFWDKAGKENTGFTFQGGPQIRD